MPRRASTINRSDYSVLAQDEAGLSSPRRHLVVYAVACLHCVAAVQFGYHTAIMSPAMAPIADHFGIARTASTSSASAEGGGTLINAILVGALVGSLFSGAVADRIGRNTALVCTEIVFTVGAAVCSLASSVWMLISGRLVLGLAVGSASVTVPLMIGELAPQEIRGQIGVLNQLGITLGILLAYGLGTAFLLLPTQGWRVMMAFPALLCVVHVVASGLFVRIESPRWLIMRSKYTDARTTLHKIRRSPNVEEEMAELQTAQEASGKAPSFWRQIRMLASPFRPLVIAVGLMFFQQITGINAAAQANYMSIVIGGINVVMTIASVFLVDRAGRKPLLLVSLGGMAAALSGIGAVAFAGVLSEPSRGILSVSFTIFFIVCFSIGLGAVPWCVIGELFPSSTRALAVSVALFVNWGTNLCVSLAYLHLVEVTSLSAVFWGFAGLSVLGFVFVLALLPETKGRTVEEIVSSMQ
eukprot:m51a1_g2288 hypothetical protein (470) ;mRNA; f:405168-407151